VGPWRNGGPSKLPGGLQWNTVFLGKENYRQKDWEGMLEKVSAKLSKWKWLLPELSYRGRVLVTNNLAASMLWHRLNVLDPPNELIKVI